MKAILIHFIFGLMFNVALYLAVGFVHWDLLWVKQLPVYSEIDRMGLLLMGLCLNAICHFFIAWGRWVNS